ncbi:hypothetical protein PINS_up015618 [Pythium insidiosum]|nr:hypothetical protein PINS_up015618 [Pythium insidiosum]
MDLAYLESVPGVQYYGDELRDFRAKTRRDVAQLRKELSEKQYIFESRAASLYRKEEIIQTFKENRKVALEAHRTKAIDQARPEKALLTSSPLPTVTDPAQRIDVANGELENESNQQERVHGASAPSSASKAELTAEEAEQKLLRHELLGEDDAFTTPVVHDLCATLIQKVARGKLARAAFEVMKIEYYVGSKYIQAVIRGFLARRRVAKMYWQLTASVILQRMIRGMLARRLARKKRQARLEERSVRRLQRVMRGHFGRVRMSKIRTLLSARETLGRSAYELSPSDLKELSAACLDMVFIPSLFSAKRSCASRCSLTPLVLGLVRILMVLTTDSDSDVDVANVRWKDAATFLQNGVGLQRRMAKAAHAVAKPTSTVALRDSPLALSLLDMYARDAAFSRKTFERLERGWRAATAIFDWINAFAVVSRVQDVLLQPPRPRPPVMASLPSRPFVPPTLFRYANALDAAERSHERIEAEENSVQSETIERRFVPRDLVRAANFPRQRPRAMLVVVAMDVPRTAAQRILDRLTTALPGRFVRLNQRNERPREHVGDIRQRWNRAARDQCAILGAEFSSVYAAIRMGNSVILDCDIGLTDAQQRRFVGAFAALNAAIKPSPQCILVRGSLLNRRMLDSPGTWRRDDGREAQGDVRGQRRVAPPPRTTGHHGRNGSRQRTRVGTSRRVRGRHGNRRDSSDTYQEIRATQATAKRRELAPRSALAGDALFSASEAPGGELRIRVRGQSRDLAGVSPPRLLATCCVESRCRDRRSVASCAVLVGRSGRGVRSGGTEDKTRTRCSDHADAPSDRTLRQCRGVS